MQQEKENNITFTVVSFWMYIALLTVLLLIPFPERQGPPGPDKVIHFSAFLILGSFHFFAYGRSIKAFVILLLYAGLIEAAQGLTGYRSFEWLDMAANFAGCLVSQLWLLSNIKSVNRSLL